MRYRVLLGGLLVVLAGCASAPVAPGASRPAASPTPISSAELAACPSLRVSHLVQLDASGTTEAAVQARVGDYVRMTVPPDTPYPVPSVSGTAIRLVCGTWTNSIKSVTLRAGSVGQGAASTADTSTTCGGCNHGIYGITVSVTKA